MRISPFVIALALSGCTFVDRSPRNPPPRQPPPQQPQQYPSQQPQQPPRTPPPSNGPPPMTQAQPAPVVAAPGAREVAIRKRVTDEFDAHTADFRACYDSAGNYRRGRVTFRFTVAPSGDVVVIKDEGSSFDDPAVVRCLTRAISAIRFTPWDGKAVDIVQPMEFAPAG